MKAPPESDVTQLLQDWGKGDQAALERLMQVVYGELHRLAEGRMRRERANHTLQPTALVNEAYFRLVAQDRVQWRNRIQFFAVASQLMRRILVDHARRRSYAKREGGHRRITLDEGLLVREEKSADLVQLDDALVALAAFDERKSRVVELRIFGGLTIEETAEVLQVATGTVINDYKVARAWLYREMQQGPSAVVPGEDVPGEEPKAKAVKTGDPEGQGPR